MPEEQDERLPESGPSCGEEDPGSAQLQIDADSVFGFYLILGVLVALLLVGLVWLASSEVTGIIRPGLTSVLTGIMRKTVYAGG